MTPPQGPPTTATVEPSTTGCFLRYAAATHQGCVRPDNQDAFVCRDRRLFAVCDGVGGLADGDVAARKTVRTMSDHYPTFRPRVVEALEDLAEAVRAANHIVFTESKHRDPSKSMATTIAALLFSMPLAVIAHVGDSRVYRLRGGALEQLTRDHTALEHIAGEDGQQYERLLLTRAIGAETHVEVETQIVDVHPEDIFLVCSDGLYEAVPEERIRECLQWSRLPRLSVGRLIDRALSHQANDNVTALVVRVEPRARPPLVEEHPA